ncbi:MAG TPA: hypothetical protein VE465_02170 [Streptosporangiaceae bacterium]|jgi:hypothetical protein|nr:hypothetical protein [Streptosporangiaceae bacterium]
MTGEQSPAEHQTALTRDGRGRFTRSLATAKRDAEAARLRSRGLSYRAIAAELGMEAASAHEAVQRALKATVAEPAADVRQLELERLDTMHNAALAVLEREHVVVSGSKIVYRVVEYATDGAGNILLDEDGHPKAARIEPLKDDAPVLRAVETLLKIQARRAALLGLDAPVKAETGVTLNYNIVGVDLEQL